MELDRKAQHATSAIERRRAISANDQRSATATARTSARTLQECLGNQAAQLFVARLQRKPTVSAPGDPLERQADIVADQVMRMSEQSTFGSAQGVVQRACKECEEEKEKRALIHRVSSVHSTADLDVSAAVSATEKSGAALPADVRSFFEPRFGHDFSGVRVHTDSEAARAAQGVEARAYTIGRHIVFGAHEYAPGNVEGRRLLAHELAHVVQQGEAEPPHSDTAEYKADAVARTIDAGQKYSQIAATSQGIQRKRLHTGRILNEGDCEHLACNSKWACVDDETGVTCPEGTRNETSKTKHKYRPLFTCDTKCENDHTCDSSDTYLAMPKARFSRTKCGKELVVCANGQSTTATVRDRSERAAWEVSPAVLTAVGVSSGDIEKGAIYDSAADPAIGKDKRCNP